MLCSKAINIHYFSSLIYSPRPQFLTETKCCLYGAKGARVVVLVNFRTWLVSVPCDQNLISEMRISVSVMEVSQVKSQSVAASRALLCVSTLPEQWGWLMELRSKGLRRHLETFQNFDRYLFVQLFLLPPKNPEISAIHQAPLLKQHFHWCNITNNN